MGSNRFYISIIIYCLLIFAAAFLFFYFLTVREQPSTAAGIAIVAFLILIRLIYVVNRANRLLSSFLVYMMEKDPSLHYTSKYADKNFRGLNESLEKLIREFKENRIDLEVQAQYLDAILGNIASGIICFDKDGKLRTMNQSAKKILACRNIEQLKDLETDHPGLAKRLLKMGPKSELVEEIHSGERSMFVSFLSSQIRLGSDIIHIISLNDISKQMEEQEIRSWKKLIRVINHEIMNSMTPIITLSMAIRRKLGKNTPDALVDAIQSAEIIEERSSGLVNFIERYKKLTGLPGPKMELFAVEQLFSRVEQLYREELAAEAVAFSFDSNCTMEINADKQMMEQLMINLVKNALEAVKGKEDAHIELSCHPTAEGQVNISVIDNGEGIPADKLEQVFVPFFSTREEGSGIGLSLCKQIILLHQGQILIESKPGKGASVIIRV